jgi:hypothetical protein
LLAACLVAVASLAWTSRDARATVLIPMDLRELARSATLVVRARCADARADLLGEPATMNTEARFDVLEVAKGDSRVASLIVRQPGGTNATRSTAVAGTPVLVAGNEAVLFLEPRGEMRVQSSCVPGRSTRHAR